MPSAARKLSYRPFVEGFEKRDVPTVGLGGQVAEVIAPPAFLFRTSHQSRAERIAVARGDALEAWANAPDPFVGPRFIDRATLQPERITAARAAAIEARAETPDPFGPLGFIDRAALRPGDILVSTEDATISSAIRTATMSAYSHAALYVGNGKIIDATGAGVQRRDLSALTGPATRVGVIRFNQLTSLQGSRVVSTAGSLVGKSYNTFGLIFGGVVELLPIYRMYRLVTGEPLKVSGSTLGPGYFCSELVIKAYNKAGIKIAPERGDTPAGIINYSLNRPSQFQLVGRLATGNA